MVVVAFTFAAFHIYTAGFGLAPDMVQRAVHVNFGIALSVMGALGRFRSRWVPAVLVLVVALATTSTVWLGFNYERLILDPFWTTSVDFAMGGVMVVAVVVAAYLLLGLPFVVLALVALAYARFGYLVPGPFGIPPFDSEYIVQVLYGTTRGLWGITTAATATSVAVFVIFGGIFLFTDGANCFLRIAQRLVGGSVGGPAKVATVFSALFGMVSGSAAANASVTGNYTIPMMKKAGYRPEKAAGIEAAASAGGQIAPPIMGAAAFVMAEFLGVSYGTIITAAAIPAALYFFGMLVAADIHGRVHDIRPLDKPDGEPLDWRSVSQFVLPIGAFLGCFQIGLSETYAGFWGIVVLIAVYLVTGHGDLRKRVANILRGIVQGGRSLVLIAVLAGAAQIVVGVIGITGVGLTITQLVVAASGGMPLLALVLVALVIIVMSMGMPTTAAYVLGIAIGGPALQSCGLTPIATHMFVFYFASAAALTPPVCAGVFVAAGIAGADWFKSSLVAMWFGIGKYLVPFVFAFSDALLLQDVDLAGLVVILSAFAGIGVISAALALIGGGGGWSLRLLIPWLLVAGAALLYPNIWVSGVGFAATLGALVWARLAHFSPMWVASAGREPR